MDGIAYAKEVLNPAFLLGIATMVWRQSINMEKRFTQLEEGRKKTDDNVSELWRKFNDQEDKIADVREKVGELRGHQGSHD